MQETARPEGKRHSFDGARSKDLVLDLAPALLAWYDHNARSLPWRYQQGDRPDPYRVWLSEVMLQQTTVATVKTFFQDFTSRWPSVKDLADANIDEVLHAWQGLGYYARARNLHKCAQEVAYTLQGQFPQDVEDLLKLPGVGAYTAAAISAIAFNRVAVAVDGNVERVFARVLGLETPLPALKKTIQAEVAPYVPQERPGDYTQALMDLGATLCRPKAPNCLLCPLQNMCVAKAQGRSEALPARSPKKPKPIRKTLFYWIEDAKGHVLVERRPDKGLLGGMVGFPSGDWVKTDRQSFDLAEQQKQLETCGAGAVLTPTNVTHIFTHFRLEAEVGVCRIHDQKDALAGLYPIPNIEAEEPQPEAAPLERMFWHPKDKLKDLALPTLMKKVAHVVLT